jgi:hypothetical protein
MNTYVINYLLDDNLSSIKVKAKDVGEACMGALRQGKIKSLTDIQSIVRIVIGGK